jgi:hypothetical protein
MMPTTESNARAIAFHRGYLIETRRGDIVIRIAESGDIIHECGRWSDALKFLIVAPRIDNDGGSAA